VANVLGAVIGSISMSGSVIAIGKLYGWISASPVTYSGQQVVNAIVAAVIVILGVFLVVSPAWWVLVAMMVLAIVLGVAIVLPIGGADMPVVISLLNSFTGLAAAFTGFVLNSNVLIISGALVGASGTLLTLLMGKAMNRSVTNVLFGAFGTAGAEVSGAAAGSGGSVHEISPDDAATLMAYANQVSIVPGYGMAVAQAQ